MFMVPPGRGMSGMPAAPHRSAAARIVPSPPSSTSTYQANWAPTISNVPNTLVSGSTYTITGYQFNGLTQASAYGDESQNATGYPLVRITNTASGHVFYARTHDHSTMAIATGNTLVSTSFDVPANIEAGPSTLQVVANGIPSASVAVNVTVVSLATNTTLSSSLNPSLYGQTITLSANTSANGIPATGTVRFMSGAVTIASANLNNSGQASATMSSLPVGNNSLQAIYSPTGNFSASASATLTQTIHVASSSTKLTSSRNPALSGMTVTLTATVSAASPSKATPTGSVTFKDGAQVLLTTALNNRGQATLSTIALSKGTHLIGVTYSGDQGVSASATSMIQVVQ